MLLLSLLACWGRQTVGCPDYDAAKCASYDGCAVISGFPLTWNDETACYDIAEAEDVGCMSAELDCDAVITYASPGDGLCYEFSDGCVPDGWTSCAPDPNEVGLCAAS